jgi:hypothetical protein
MAGHTPSSWRGRKAKGNSGDGDDLITYLIFLLVLSSRSSIVTHRHLLPSSAVIFVSGSKSAELSALQFRENVIMSNYNPSYRRDTAVSPPYSREGSANDIHDAGHQQHQDSAHETDRGLVSPPAPVSLRY